MNQEGNYLALIANAAKKNGIEPALLVKLLELESDFSKLEGPGVRTDFARQVAQILEQANYSGEL